MRKKLIFGKTAAPCVSCYWQTFLPPAAAAASAWMSLLAQPAAAVLLFWRSPRPSRRLHSKQLFLNMALDGGTKKGPPCYSLSILPIYPICSAACCSCSTQGLPYEDNVTFVCNFFFLICCGWHSLNIPLRVSFSKSTQCKS
jgi:hypothetical protein